MGSIWAEHVLPMFCACSLHGNSMNNLLSYCGLINEKTRASDKDLAVPVCLRKTQRQLSLKKFFFNLVPSPKKCAKSLHY